MVNVSLNRTTALPMIVLHKTPNKTHIIPFSLLFTIIFTYAGVEYPIWVVHTHLDYNINFVVNFLTIYWIFRFVYYLNFRKSGGLVFNILISLLVLVLEEIASSILFEYDQEDFTEMYSITLPFGSLLLIVINVYYQLVKQNLIPENSPTNPSQEQLPKILPIEEHLIWLDAAKGKEKVREVDIQFAHLQTQRISHQMQRAVHYGFLFPQTI